MKWGGSSGGGGEGFWEGGGSIEVPKLKQLTSKTSKTIKLKQSTSKTCKNIKLKQSILNAINS